MKKLQKNGMKSAGFLSILTYWWMNELFKNGSKSSLQETDMLELIKADTSEEQCSILERTWKNEIRNGGNKKPSLLRAILVAYRTRILVAGMVAVLLEFLRMGIAVIIADLVQYFEKQDTTPVWHAYAYAVSVTVSTVILALVHHQLFYQSFRTGWQVRVALCALMYKKTLRMSQKALCKTTTGKIVNLGATDVLRFDHFAAFVYYCLIGPIQCIVAATILWSEFGVAIIGGMGTLFVAMMIQTLCGKAFAMLRLLVAEITDDRVLCMNEVIAGMRIIKMYTWEKPFAKLLSKIRRREVRRILQSASVKACNMTIFICQEKVVAFATLAIYISNGGVLTAYKIFLLIGILGALRISTGSAFLRSIERTSEAFASSKRIEEFLLSDEFSRELPAGNKLDSSDTYVEMKDFCARWGSPDEENLSLDGLSFRVDPGELLAVIGPVGSGKSSLLNAILGELPVMSGKVIAQGKVTYAAQTPWVFSGTVRDNILFGELFDAERYKTVISSCCLSQDINLLPDGDMTLVGERGVTLSGGQKARINLARAAYRTNSTICLLDDPLSAVDPNVARHIFIECISGTLKDKARILVTHQLQLLRYVDRILILKEGKVAGYGTFDELTALKTNFASLLQPKHDDVPSHHKENPDGNWIKFSQFARNSHRASQRSAMSAISFGEDINEDHIIPVEPEEEREQGSIETKVYTEYFRNGAYAPFLVLLIIFMAATHVIYIMNDWWLTQWAANYNADKANEANNLTSGDFKYNYTQSSVTMTDTSTFALEQSIDDSYYLRIYALLCSLLVLVGLLRFNLNMYVCVNSGIHMHKRMMKAIFRAPIRFFDTNPVGRILNRFSKDMGQVDELLPMTYQDFLYLCGHILSVITMVAIINYFALIVIIPSVVYFIWIRRYFMRTARDIKRLEGACRSPVFSLLSSTLQGLVTVRGFGVESKFEEKFHDSQDLHSASWFLFLTGSRWFGLRLDLMSAMFLGTTALLSVIAASVLNMDAGKVGLILTHSASCMALFQWGVRQSAEVENFMTSVERIQQYYRLKPEAPEEVPKNKPHADWPTQGSIEFSKASFAYYDGGPNVLKSLTIKIHPKEKIGLVGRTGAGKSSVISALFRLAELTEGEIFIDGIGISSIGLSDLRSAISIIPQDPILFSGTLRRNLDLFNNYTDEEIWNSLKQVQLYEFAISLPNKLETHLAESGTNFSVGQRQLVCLARALLQRSHILLIDEATANVDVRTDELIQITIREKFTECTVITIAHRINTIIDSDRIIVLDAGIVREFDAPHLLLQRDKGAFSAMVNAMGMRAAERLRQSAKAAYNKNQI